MKRKDPEAYVYDLISRINRREPVGSSEKDVRWLAYREADNLDDPALYPVLESVIVSNEGKENADIRKGAYIIMERLLKNCFERSCVDFLLDRAQIETDGDVRVAVLNALSDVKVTGDSDISILIALADHPAWQIRFAALCALGSFSTPESKTALYDFLERDRKKYKNEIVYAIASLGRIGTADDIPALEKFLEVHIQDMKIAAEFAIDRIKERICNHET